MCVDTNREKKIRIHLPLFWVIIVIDDNGDDGDDNCWEKQSAIVPVCPCMSLLGIPNK